jgi:hypothetical protein
VVFVLLDLSPALPPSRRPPLSSRPSSPHLSSRSRSRCDSIEFSELGDTLEREMSSVH